MPCNHVGNRKCTSDERHRHISVVYVRFCLLHVIQQPAPWIWYFLTRMSTDDMKIQLTLASLSNRSPNDSVSWGINAAPRGTVTVCLHVQREKNTVRCGFFIIFRCFRKISKSQLLASSCLSVSRVSPSVRMEQLGCHWTDFDEIWYLGISRKSVEKFQAWLKCYRNNSRHFVWKPTHIFDFRQTLQRKSKYIFLYSNDRASLNSK